MRILLLSNSASEHTQKWAKGLAARGVEVGIFSLNPSSPEWYKNEKGISILHEPSAPVNNKRLATKLAYIKETGKLKKIIDSFKPDIVHAHYATSYGMLGMLAGFRPYVISVWGADVYDFPEKSVMNKMLLRKILNSADHLCSTSHCMKRVTQENTKNEITVIPFGVDTAKFEALPIPDLNKTDITIGLIKSLERKYGIDILIRAFAAVTKTAADKKLRLVVVGGGSERETYVELAKELEVSELVSFPGKVPHDSIIDYLASFDIFASLSILDSESFGVSMVEAMSSGRPIVASDADGFVEVLGGEETGFIVPKLSVEAASEAIMKYIQSPELAAQKAKAARIRANGNYEWKNNVEQMLNVYKLMLK